MRKAFLILGAACALAIGLSIDIFVLIGLLPVSAAACVSVIAAIIVTATKPSNNKTSPGRSFAYINAAPALRAAENGEDYVIAGKSIHNNPGQFE